MVKQYYVMLMLFGMSLASHRHESDELSTIEHYRLLLHFARKLLRGDLLRGEKPEYLRVQEHYTRVVNDEVRDFISLRNKKILEVGGCSGVFSRVFSEELGAELAINVEPFCRYDKELHWPDRVRGAAQALPFVDNQFDFVFCRQVLEHVRPPECLQRCVDDMYRVTKKGGVCYFLSHRGTIRMPATLACPFIISHLELQKGLRFCFIGTPCFVEMQSLMQTMAFLQLHSKK